MSTVLFSPRLRISIRIRPVLPYNINLVTIGWLYHIRSVKGKQVKKKIVLEMTKVWPGLLCFILPNANRILKVLIWGFPHSNSLITPAPAVHNWDSPSSCETGRRGSPGPSTQRTSPSLWGGAPGGEEEQRRNAHNAGVTRGHWATAWVGLLLSTVRGITQIWPKDFLNKCQL